MLALVNDIFLPLFISLFIYLWNPISLNTSILQILSYSNLALINIIGLIYYLGSWDQHKTKYFKLSIINYLLLTILIYVYLNYYQPNVNCPIFTRYLIELTTLYICQEFYFYLCHRILHHRLLFKWIHYLHHQTYADSYLTAFYMHPLELLILIFPGTIIGSLFLSISLLSFLVWLIMGSFYILWSHTNITYYLLPSTNYHLIHHKYIKYNLSSYPLDYLFGTHYVS